MKKFNIYLGQNNETKQQISFKDLKQVLKTCESLDNYTLYKANGVFKGENILYDEESINIEIITDNLNYIYIEMICSLLKDKFNQECVFYTEQTIKARLI